MPDLPNEKDRHTLDTLQVYIRFHGSLQDRKMCNKICKSINKDTLEPTIPIRASSKDWKTNFDNLSKFLKLSKDKQWEERDKAKKVKNQVQWTRNAEYLDKPSVLLEAISSVTGGEYLMDDDDMNELKEKHEMRQKLQLPQQQQHPPIPQQQHPLKPQPLESIVNPIPERNQDTMLKMLLHIAIVRYIKSIDKMDHESEIFKMFHHKMGQNVKNRTAALTQKHLFSSPNFEESLGLAYDFMKLEYDEQVEFSKNPPDWYKNENLDKPTIKKNISKLLSISNINDAIKNNASGSTIESEIRFQEKVPGVLVRLPSEETFF